MSTRGIASFVFGNYIYDSGVYRLKFEFYHQIGHNAFGYPNKLDIGIVNGNINTSDYERSANSYDRSAFPVFYGYSLASNSTTVYTRHQRNIFSPDLYEIKYHWKHGDTIELILDCDEGMLFLNVPDGQQLDVALPKWTKFKLFVALNEVNYGLKIIEVRKEY